jgi:hypothetical protein
MDMNPALKTVLPLTTWTLQKIFGPFFEPSAWRAVALSLVPPPDSLENLMMRETQDADIRRFLSPSERRRFRKQFKRDLGHEFSNGPVFVQMREHALSWRQKMEAAGYTADPSRIRKLRDVYAETNEYYTELAQSHDLLEVLPSLTPDQEQEAIGLLWEYAVYGECGVKPTIRRDSPLWKVLNIDPVQLESMPPVDAIFTLWSRFETLVGLSGDQPDESRMLRLLKWMVQTHLPAEEEPETTPHAKSRAIEAGLVYKAHAIRDKDTGEIEETDVLDPEASRFADRVEVKDELDRIVSCADLSPGEHLVLDGMRKGLQGEPLAEWVEAQGAGVRSASVPVLASRVLSKLKAAAKN